MTAKVKSMLQCILVLAVIALASGVLLGAVHVLTYVDPFQATLDFFKDESGAEGDFEMIVEKETSVDGTSGSIVYYARSTDGVHAFLAKGNGGYRGERVPVYVFIKEGTITKVTPGDYTQQTFMDELEKGFYDQFVGKDVATLKPLEADTVSGATMSSTAVRNAIDAVVAYYNGNVSGGESNG